MRPHVSVRRAQNGTHTMHAPEVMQAEDSRVHVHMVNECMESPVVCTQPPAPSLVKPALQIQSEAASLPAGASEFAEQSVHVLSAVAPLKSEYFPAPQSKHVLSAVAPLKSEYFPAPQSVHASLPLPALNLPAAQSTHAPPSGPVEPALQTHAVAAALPAREAELAGHAWHVASAVAPAASEYLPASQSVHSALPVPALNLPAAQSTHAPPSGPVEPALHTHSVKAVCNTQVVGGTLPQPQYSRRQASPVPSLACSQYDSMSANTVLAVCVGHHELSGLLSQHPVATKVAPYLSVGDAELVGQLAPPAGQLTSAGHGAHKDTSDAFWLPSAHPHIVSSSGLVAYIDEAASAHVHTDQTSVSSLLKAVLLRHPE